MKNILLIALLPLLAFGCATRPRPVPMSLADVISMTKGGMPDADIIQRIEGSHTVFRLGVADVTLLHKEGVSERVINYMMETYPRAIAEEQRRQDYYFYGGYYSGPWHYRHHPWR